MVVFKVLMFLAIVSYGAAQDNFCKCVPYYLCDNGTVITDGRRMLDERLGLKCTEDQCNCKDLTACCYVRPNDTSTSSITTVSQDTTSYVNTVSPTTYTPTTNQCGFSNPDGVGYKLGDSGEDVAFGEFPWMVLITVNNMHRCGGTLIHPSVVLTAAHCVTKRQTYNVRAGEWDISNTREIFRHQERQVVSKNIHEDYRPGILYNDIALLFLDSPFNLEQHIRIACLSPENTVAINADCIATGWGKNQVGGNGTYASILKKINLPIVERSKCQTQLKSTKLGQNFNLHKGFLCAGGVKDQDTCIGDGGGPLLCPISGENRYQQVGITSWGVDCKAEDVPGVYVNVAFFRKWIDKTIKEKNYDTTIYQY